MRRSGVVRFQVALLVLLAGLLIWRAASGPGVPDAEVRLVDLEKGQLYDAVFELDRSGPVRIDASGSVLAPDRHVPAAYPWIVRLDDGQVAWTLAVDSVTEGGTLVERIDTVALEAGAYRVYYTTFGPAAGSRSGSSFLGLRRHWTGDDKEWRFLLSPVDSVRISRVSVPDGDGGDVSPVWTSGPVRNRARSEVLIRVDEPTDLAVSALLEICDDGCDDARIVDVVTGETVWALSKAETVHAGGMAGNRAFAGQIPVAAGVYGVVVTTDRGHAYGSWMANPPWNPEAWGVTLHGPVDVVHVFDPWKDVEPVVSMIEVGNDDLRRATVVVEEDTQVLVYALGEITPGGNRYDYAWIESDDRVKIWEMSFDGSSPAGGDSKNREAVAFLDLSPGHYTVYYQTDGSHAYDSWTTAAPRHRSRWGVALFPLDPDGAGHTRIRVVEDVLEAPVDVPAAIAPADSDYVPNPIPPVAGEVLFSALGLGNDEERSGGFVLTRPTRLRIIAVGEIVRSDRYDYGWIEAESGKYAWEMTIKNTTQVGGDERNRKFDAVIVLPPGRYTARFRTDGSHAFGDFDGGAPPEPDDWGMRIVRMPE